MKESSDTHKNDGLELQKGREYIVKRTPNNPFYVKVLEVTNKLYRFQYENGNTDWVEKDYYGGNYSLVEDITDFKIGFDVRRITEQNIKKCDNCGGSGRVPDKGSSSGDQLCPVCWGSGNTLVGAMITNLD